MTEIYVGNYEYKTLDELGITIEDIKKWDIDKFNEKYTLPDDFDDSDELDDLLDEYDELSDN